MINTLRNEIIESQKARTLLLDRKLLIVATIGAIGLGSNFFGNVFEKKSPNIQFILCLIPFVCLYVDLLCKHLQMRMLVIGKFIREKFAKSKEMNNIDYGLELIGEYEFFCNKLREGDGRGIFGLEDWAQEGSTWLLSSLLVLYGIIITIIEVNNYCEKNVIYIAIGLIISGLFGIVVTFILKDYYQKRVRKIDID